ncbi:MAG: 3-hydroxybutyrate dehydrogenase [Terracidiphilus sp.]
MQGPNEKWNDIAFLVCQYTIGSFVYFLALGGGFIPVLRNRAAVVTGSTSGIGMGIARALAAEGCAVMLNGFGSPEAIEILRADLAKAYEVQVLYNGADLTQPKECAGLIADAEARLGCVDILVNNAGIQHVAPVECFPLDRWDSILAVNLSAAFHTIRAVVPSMRRRGWGRLLNIASTHGLVASVGKSAYVASKHGLIGLTKVVALETAGAGITCNAICPGWVLTPLVQQQLEEKASAEGLDLEQATRKLLLEKQPSGSFITIEQIGALAVFLCNEAASNLTGACIPVDGGWLAQ